MKNSYISSLSMLGYLLAYPEIEVWKQRLHCIDMVREPGRYVYEEKQSKTKWNESNKANDDDSSYIDEQQCSVFIQAEMDQVIKLEVSLNHKYCKKDDDELQLIDGWYINYRFIPQANEYNEVRSVSCSKAIQFQTSSNVAMIQFSLNRKVSFNLDWSVIQNPIPPCNVVAPTQGGEMTFSGNLYDCSITMISS